MRMEISNKWLFIILGVILAIITTINVICSVLFAPRKLSGLIPKNDIVKIELKDLGWFNEETQEVEEKTFVLDETRYDEFVSEIRHTKYKQRYLKCKCVASYEYIIYYSDYSEIHLDELRFRKKVNGEVVKYKDIDFEAKNFYRYFS